MMKSSRLLFFKFVILICLSSFSSLSASDSQIIESKCLSDVKNYLENNVLIILDIDNTLIEPAQQLGSDQWAWYSVKKLKDEGLSEQDAFAQTMEEWRLVHSITKVQTLEKGTCDLIHDLQSQGYSLMGLTTRAPDDAQVTLRELHQVDIDLALTPVVNSTLDLPLKKHARFFEGILFITLENKKGHAFKEFLNAFGIHPRKVIFVDDKLSHIKDVEEACKLLEIDFIGIRYGAADGHVAEFDSSIIEIQRYFLYHLLSDDQAAILRP